MKWGHIERTEAWPGMITLCATVIVALRWGVGEEWKRGRSVAVQSGEGDHGWGEQVLAGKMCAG